MTAPSHDPFAPPAPAVVGAVTAGPSYVPDGTVAEVLAWVGNDLDRAGQALYAEGAKARPRTTLVEALEDMLTSDAAEPGSLPDRHPDSTGHGEPDL